MVSEVLPRKTGIKHGMDHGQQLPFKIEIQHQSVGCSSREIDRQKVKIVWEISRQVTVVKTKTALKQSTPGPWRSMPLDIRAYWAQYRTTNTTSAATWEATKLLNFEQMVWNNLPNANPAPAGKRGGCSETIGIRGRWNNHRRTRPGVECTASVISRSLGAVCSGSSAEASDQYCALLDLEGRRSLQGSTDCAAQ